MKITELNENLQEAPGEFGKRVKAKVQKNIPFAKEQRRRGAAKDKLFRSAKEIKNDLMAWKADSFENGEKEPLTMGQFLEWLKAYRSDLGAAVESVARADKAYKDFFVTKIDKDGKASQTAKDDKVKVRDVSDDEIKKGYDKIAADAEAEAKELGSEDEVEEEVDMSASIYESRLRAFLNEDEAGDASKDDVGINPSKTLADNQIDTLIVKALRKIRQGSPLRMKPEKKSKDDEASQAADRISNATADDDEELSVASPGRDKISSDDIGAIKKRIDEFGEDILDIIRRQDGIEDSIKKELAKKIDDLVYEMINNSF